MTLWALNTLIRMLVRVKYIYMKRNKYSFDGTRSAGKEGESPSSEPKYLVLRTSA